MPIELVVVDAFTDQPFAGNPAAVCLLDESADAGWMQRVAREMNLSETAFLVRRESSGAFDLRWFTPALEVDLCGHATLGSAHVLFTDDRVGDAEVLRFHTKSGVLEARRHESGGGGGGGGGIVLDFPSEPAVAETPPPNLLSGLGVTSDAVRFVGRNRMDWLVALPDADAVRVLAPDMAKIRTLGERGVMATARADEKTPPGHDFISRYFAPTFGVDEDPVTGSAHCALGPFWAERLGKADVAGYQASARGGSVRVLDRGARVRLIGHAVITLRSRLVV